MTTISMPQLGETIVEGTILKWLKQEGETIERDEPLFEISTDKVDTEVPSPVTGTVSKILVEEGQTVPVGTDLAEISEDGAAAGGGGGAGAAPAGGQRPLLRRPLPGQRRAPSPPPRQPRRVLSPPRRPPRRLRQLQRRRRPRLRCPRRARRRSPRARQPRCPPWSRRPRRAPRRRPRARPTAGARPLRHRIRATCPTEGPGRGSSRRSFAGSPTSTASISRASRDGRGRPHHQEGRPRGDRPRRSCRGRHSPRGGAGARLPARHPPRHAATPAPTVAPVQPAVAGPGDEVVPISHIRKLIGQHMVASLQTSARAWTMVEVNIDHLVKLRDRAKEAFKAKHGVNLTYLPFVIRATCDALLTHPEVNSELRGDEIVRHRYVNMGIAVSYDAGLIVPVIKGADAMNTVGLARAIADLAARARAHQLKPDEIQGSTFTITNPGPYGSIASLPIINQPNTGILSLDAIQKRPVVIDDTIAIRSMVNISMSWDHRTIDGEIATRFLARVKQNLETWDFAEDVAI